MTRGKILSVVLMTAFWQVEAGHSKNMYLRQNGS